MGFAATPDGKLYVFGGENEDGGNESSSFIKDETSSQEELELY